MSNLLAGDQLARHHGGALALHVPHVDDLAFAAGVLVAEGFAFSHMAHYRTAK